MITYHTYATNDKINSSLASFAKRGSSTFHIEIVEALHHCVLTAGRRIIALGVNDIVVSPHYKNLEVTSHVKGPVLRKIAIDLDYPSPLNQYLVADNPLIHDLMNDESGNLTYVVFRNLNRKICFNYMNLLQIFAAKKADDYIEFQAQRVAGLLFTELLRDHRAKISKSDSAFPSSQVKYASKDTQSGTIMRYITQKNGNVTLSQVAQHFGYQPNYLSRLCHKLFDLDFIHLRLNIRMTIAVEQLKLTTKGIEEISSELGYKDVSSFTKQFTDYHHITPSAYRKKYAVYY